MVNDSLMFLTNKYERDKILLENRLIEVKQVEVAKLSLQVRSFSNTRTKIRSRIKYTEKSERDDMLKMHLLRKNYSHRLLIH